MEQPLTNDKYYRSWHRPIGDDQPWNETKHPCQQKLGRLMWNPITCAFHTRGERHTECFPKVEPSLSSRKLSKAGGLSGSENLGSGLCTRALGVPSDFLDHFLVQSIFFSVEMIHFKSIRGRHLPDIFVQHSPNRVCGTLLPQQPANILLHPPIPQHSTTGFLTAGKPRFYRPPTRRQSDYLL